MVKYMQSSKQRRDFIDVTKFALSILIVVIHISPIESLNPVLRPFLRTAVPLFFLISAYLFFKKYGEAETIEKKSLESSATSNATCSSISSGS